MTDSTPPFEGPHDSTDRLASALAYATVRGWPVFPLHNLLPDGQCSCGDPKCKKPGKHPRTAHGFKDATTDQAQIVRWWTDWPDANIGLPTGINFDVLDLDGEDGRAWLTEMEELHGPLLDGLRARSGGGGMHIYLKPTGHGNAAFLEGRRVDFRGKGGYIIAAPSATVAPYEWIGDPVSAQIPEAPEWFLAVLSKPEAEQPTIRGTIPVGGRNQTLFNMARGMAGSNAGEDIIFTALKAIRDQHADAGDEPVQDAELHDLARQGVKYRPRLRPPGDVDAAPDDSALAVDGRDGALEPPAPEAFDGLLGEFVRLHEGHTTASPVALLGSAIAVAGALIPGRLQYHGWQTTSVYTAIVAPTGGGKYTALSFIGEAFTSALGDWHDLRIDGLNSGEALIRDLSAKRHGIKNRRSGTLTVEPVDPCTAVLVEEELASLFTRGRRDGSTLDTELRKAFDGIMLSTGKSESRATVTPPYYLTAIGHITQAELRQTIASVSLTNGSANRWIWLPVEAVDVVADGRFPAIPASLVKRLHEAQLWASENHATGVSLTPEAKDLADEYRAFLMGLPGSHDLTVRLHVIALRIGLIHALANGERSLTAPWMRSGVALTEYARSGLASVFGRMTGTPEADLLARRLQAAGRLTGREQKAAIYDSVKRQAAADRLQVLGLAAVDVKSGPKGGRPANYLVWTGMTSGSTRFTPEVRGVGGVGVASRPADDDDRGLSDAEVTTNPRSDHEYASPTNHQPPHNTAGTTSNLIPMSLFEIAARRGDSDHRPKTNLNRLDRRDEAVGRAFKTPSVPAEEVGDGEGHGCPPVRPVATLAIPATPATATLEDDLSFQVDRPPPDPRLDHTPCPPDLYEEHIQEVFRDPDGPGWLCPAGCVYPN